MIAHVVTSIDTSDAAVKSAAGLVYWVVASAGATGGAWPLNDSTADGGTDRVSAVSPATSRPVRDVSQAPVKFESGIYADIPGTNVTLTVGYI